MNRIFSRALCVVSCLGIVTAFWIALQGTPVYAQSSSMCSALLTAPSSNASTQLVQSAQDLQSVVPDTHVVVSTTDTSSETLQQYAVQMCPNWYTTVKKGTVTIKSNYVIVLVNIANPEVDVEIGSNYQVDAQSIATQIDMNCRAGNCPVGLAKGLTQIHDAISPSMQWIWFPIAGIIGMIGGLIIILLLRRLYASRDRISDLRNKAIRTKRGTIASIQELETILMEVDELIDILPQDKHLALRRGVIKCGANLRKIQHSLQTSSDPEIITRSSFRSSEQASNGYVAMGDQYYKLNERVKTLTTKVRNLSDQIQGVLEEEVSQGENIGKSE